MAEKKKWKGYSFKERGAFHAKRAKNDSDATPEQRAYSRGWLQNQKNSSKAFKFRKKKFENSDPFDFM